MKDILRAFDFSPNRWMVRQKITRMAFNNLQTLHGS